MKKILAILLALGLLCACTTQEAVESSDTSTTNPNISAIEGAREVDMSGYEGMSDYNHNFMAVTTEEMLTLINSDGTGIFYLGSTECSMCQYAVRLIQSAAAETDATIYYIDVYNDADGFNASLTYVMDTIEPILEERDGEKVVMTPHVFAVKDGEFTGSEVGLDNGYDGTEATENIQIEIYKEIFESIN